MDPVRYYSTNRALDLPGIVPFRATVDLTEALFLGQAPDGGLFMPTHLPPLKMQRLEGMRGASYAEVACEVLWPFVAGSLSLERFEALCAEAYDFEVPLEPLGEGISILRLDRGPTASFKDFAARLLARMMVALQPDGRTITVLVATSGDTGSAVGEAFHGLSTVQVVLLYPAREVSARQRQQLDTIGDNVRAVAVDDTFDACQEMVKQAFLDPDLAHGRLTSANSINIGRILPQSVYYVYAYLQVATAEQPVTFVVPSGNFGNAFGAELARRRGLPVDQLVLAVNTNDAFPRWLATEYYQPVRPSRACLSNAMNVGNPSNLARFFDLYGGSLTRDGVVHQGPDLAAMRRWLCSVSIDDDTTVAAIQTAYRETGCVLEPHGAVGFAAMQRLGLPQPDAPVVLLETAHPAKFPEIVHQAIGIDPEPPPALRRALSRSGRADTLPAEYPALKQYLEHHVLD